MALITILLILLLSGFSGDALAAFTVFPPTVAFVAPQAGGYYVAPAVPVFYVTAFPSRGDPTVAPSPSVVRVEFLDGDVLIGAVTTPSSGSADASPTYAFAWNNPPLGMHLIYARVFDSEGYSAMAMDFIAGLSAHVTVAVTAASAPPIVSLTTPSTGQVFAWSGSIPLAASATSAPAAIRRVEFLAGNTVAAVAYSPPYAAQWNNPPPGDFTVVAKAYDDHGEVAASSPAYVRVVAFRSPAVVLTAPSAGSVVPSGAPILVSAVALAPDDSIARVEFYSGLNLIGTILTAPYTYSFDNPQAGPLSFTAKAYDIHGVSSTSAPLNVTVTNAATPIVSIVAPVSGSTYIAPATISLSATATEPGGTIAKVEFFANATLVGTATNSPFNFTWAGVSAGNYILTAKATDSLSRSAASSPVNVTVATDATSTVSITVPLAGAQFAQGQPIVLTASAATPARTIDRIEFYADSTLLGSVAIPGGKATTTANFSWNGASVGSHSVAAKVIATDGTGVLSASVNVSVSNFGVTLTEPYSGQVYQSPGDIRIAANPTGGGAVSRVEFFGDGTLLGSAAAAPYAFLWSGVASGAHVVSATARDMSGLVAASGTVSVSVVSAPTVTVDTSIDGSTVEDDNVSVSGIVQAPANSSIGVNGQLAALGQDGHFYADGVSLQPGANVVTITVNTQDGAPVTTTIVLNRSGIAPFSVDLTPTQGLAPLDVQLTITNRGNVSFDRIEIDTNADGTPDLTLTNLVDNEARLSLTYENPGLHRIRVTVFNAANQAIYTATRSVLARDPRDLSGLVTLVYTGMLDRLRAGNVSGAIGAVTKALRPKYQSVFSRLGSRLPSVIDNGFGVVGSILVTNEFADITIVRTKQDGPYGYHILLIRDDDGLWRIDGM